MIGILDELLVRFVVIFVYACNVDVGISVVNVLTDDIVGVPLIADDVDDA